MTNELFKISTIADGPMTLTGHAEFDTVNLANREKYLASLGISPKQVVCSSLVHGARVEAVSSKFAGIKIQDGVDGLITDVKGLYLSVLAADCFPVAFFDPINKIIGIAHCGWRGISRCIIENMIEKMEREFNCQPENIRVSIGPGIRTCHFEVDKDVAEIFYQKGCINYIHGVNSRVIDPLTPKFKIALELIIESKLIDSGIKSYNIFWDNCECTYCSTKYYSWRRDRSNPLKAQMAIVGLPLK